jgi:hypothetical protein
MKSIEVFLAILITIIILIFLYHKSYENFNSFSIMCDDNKYNSNCLCPPDRPIKKIEGSFPYDYGTDSPYVFKCDKN